MNNKEKFLSFFKKSLNYYSFVFFLLVLIPLSVFGDSHSGAGAGNNQKSGAGAGNSQNLNIDVKIENPLGSKINSLPDFIEAILNIVVTIGVPIVALAIIYTGFLFVTAQGNSEKLKTAKNALLYTLIGAALVLGAWILANAIAGTVDQIRNEAQ